MSWDLQSVISTLMQIVSGGVGTWAVTELIKIIPKIPINAGQATRIRLVAGALSAISVALFGFVNDSLKPDDLQGAVTAILAVIGTFGTAFGVHKTLKGSVK